MSITIIPSINRTPNSTNGTQNQNDSSKGIERNNVSKDIKAKIVKITNRGLVSVQFSHYITEPAGYLLYNSE